MFLCGLKVDPDTLKDRDRDAPLTTSLLIMRNNFNPKLNPLKCADQWDELSRQRPRLAGESSVKLISDWTRGYPAREMHQSQGIFQERGRDAEPGSHERSTVLRKT